MSNFKEGEGVVVINPDPFTSYHIKPGERYLIVVLAGTAVVEASWAEANVKYDPALHDSGMFIQCLPNNVYQLISRSRLFYTHYSEFYDVLIKDYDGRTIKALTNVEVIRE